MILSISIFLLSDLSILKKWQKPDILCRAMPLEGYIVVKGNEKNSLWVRCPDCGGKTRTKVYEDTVLVNFPLYCPKCKKERRIDVANLRMVLSK